MSKIKNTGVTDKWGFRHTSYVATATKKNIFRFDKMEVKKFQILLINVTFYL